MICRLDCPGIRSRALPHLVVLHGYFLSLRPFGQLRRQLALRSYCRWCCIRSGFGILARRIWSALNICRKIQWLFWFSQLQGPFTSSLSALNWCYVNKNWYTSLNFQGCVLCWAIRNKIEVLAHIKDFEVSSSWRGTIYFKCFLLPWDLRDVFWFLDISGKDS